MAVSQKRARSLESNEAPQEKRVSGRTVAEVALEAELANAGKWVGYQVPESAWAAKFAVALEHAGGVIENIELPRRVSSAAAKTRHWAIDANGHLMRYMKCHACGQQKPCTTAHYNASSTTYANALDWFSKTVAGFEPFTNNKIISCKTCTKAAHASKLVDDVDAWVKSIMAPYTGLHVTLSPQERDVYKKEHPAIRMVPVTDRGQRWFWSKWNDFEYCRITGLRKEFFELGPRKLNGISVGGIIKDASIGLKHDPKNREPSTTELCASFSNVQRGVSIPELSWEPFYKNHVNFVGLDIDARNREEEYACTRAQQNLSNTPRQNGVTVLANDRFYGNEISKVQLRAMVTTMVQLQRAKDIKAGRENGISAKEHTELYLSILFSQKFRCAISMSIMTIENGMFHFSFDRIDNTVAHVAGNVHAVCRVFNIGNGAPLTRRRFLQIFLRQVLVPVPDVVRTVTQSMYDACPS